MTALVSEINHTEIPKPAQEQPKGKFQRFCDWTKANKKAIAVTILIIGVACLTFGVGSLLAIIPLSHFTVLHMGSFIAGLFTYSGLDITGLSTTGILFFTGLGAVIAGGMFAGFGSGMLAGIPGKEEEKKEKIET